MLSVNGIFDGKLVRITDKINEKRKFKVVITFIEELKQDDKALRNFSSQTKSLDFLEDPRENIYQYYLAPKSKLKIPTHNSMSNFFSKKTRNNCHRFPD